MVRRVLGMRVARHVLSMRAVPPVRPSRPRVLGIFEAQLRHQLRQRRMQLLIHLFQRLLRMRCEIANRGLTEIEGYRRGFHEKVPVGWVLAPKMNRPRQVPRTSCEAQSRHAKQIRSPFSGARFANSFSETSAFKRNYPKLLTVRTRRTG